MGGTTATPQLDRGDQLTAWVDGQCRLCRGFQAWVEDRDEGSAVRFCDFRQADDRDLPRARAEHEQRLWVGGAEGELEGGFDGVLRILAALPGWQGLARLGARPLVRRIGRRLYAVVARHRQASGGAASSGGDREDTRPPGCDPLPG